MGPTSDRTAVTGAPSLASPRTGEVIGERYEIRHRLRDDPYSFGFLAFDQETENRVMLRVFRTELVEANREVIFRKLRENVGIGGKYLPGLLDADRDANYVYATESVPDGAPFRALLDRRIAEGKPLTAEELLPVLTHLDAALAAVPTTLFHGDVRADQVWVNAEAMYLMGAFFVPALPGGVVAAVLQRHGDLRRRQGPELVQGSPSRASDRFAVAAIVYEALTLQPPPDPGAGVDPGLGRLAQPLGALLHPDPKRRSATFEPLLETLARVAGLSVSELQPAPFRKPRRMMRKPTRPELKAPPEEFPDPTAPFPALDTAAAARALESSDHVHMVDSDAQTAVRSEATTDAKTVVVGDPKAIEEITAVRKEPPSGESDTTVVAPPPKRPAAGAQTRPELDSDKFDGEAFDDADTAAELDASTSKLPALSKKKATAILDDDTRALRKLSETGEPVRQPLARDEDIDTGHHVSVVESPEKYEKALAPEADPTALDHRLDALVPPDLDKVPSDPAIEAKPAKESSVDPRFLRAARSSKKAKERKPFPSDPGLPAEPDSDSSLDPRLVRAALGMSMESDDEEVSLDPSVPAKAKPGGTQQLHVDELEIIDDDEEDGVPLDPSVPATAAKDGTQELHMDELDVLEQQATGNAPMAATSELTLDDLQDMEAERRRADVPGDVKQVPRARKDSGLGFGGHPVLFDDSKAVPALPAAAAALLATTSEPPRAAPPSPVRAPAPVPARAPAPVSAPAPANKPAPAPAPAPVAPKLSPPARPTPILSEVATPPISNPKPPRTDDTQDPIVRPRRVDEAPRSRLGIFVIVTALVLGIGIIAASFFYARHKKAQAEEIRMQRIQDRIERIQQENEAGSRMSTMR